MLRNGNGSIGDLVTEAAETGDVVVIVPARGDFVHVLRSVVASVCARLDMPYDAIDDLRLAADEACAHLLDAATSARELHLRIRPTDDSIELLAATDADIADWPPPRSRSTLTWQILTALADDVRYESWLGRPALRFTKRLNKAASTP